MKKLLITGAGGFLGACASDFFHKKGYEVFAASRNPENSWRISILKCANVSLDINDASSCQRAIQKTAPDCILNFAAYGAYPGAQTDSSLMHKTNVDGVKNLLQCAKENSIPNFIQIGSSSEYGPKNHPMSESDSSSPIDDYGKSKLQATNMVLNYDSQTKICVARPFSPFGEFEESRRLIPTLILSALNKKPAQLSSPNSKRDFTYVQNFNEGLEHILNSNKSWGEIFNLSQGSQISVGEMANLVHELILASPPPQFGKVQNPRAEPAMWQADISKAKKVLGWEPKISQKEGLQKTIEWMNKNKKFYSQ